MEKILFLEDKKYFDMLGLKEIYKKYKCEFNGIRYYKISSSKLKSYKAIISFLYHNPISNFIILKAKRLGVKTIFLSDGIYEFANAYKNEELNKYKLKLFDPIIHNIFLCIGKKEKKLFQNSYNHVEQFLPKRVLNIKKEKIILKEKGKILITTANTAYFNEIEKKQLILLMKEVIKELEKLKLDYIFRIFDSELIKVLRIEPQKNYKNGTFEQILEKVEYVITTPSSISLTSMYHQRAVAQLIYRDTPLLLQSGWNISKSYPIRETLTSFIKKDKERMNFQNNILKEYIIEKEIDEILDDIINKEYKIKIENFIKTNEENMLNSIFNFNVEYFFRKIYLVIKKNRYIKQIKKYIK